MQEALASNETKGSFLSLQPAVCILPSLPFPVLFISFREASVQRLIYTRLSARREHAGSRFFLPVFVYKLAPWTALIFSFYRVTHNGNRLFDHYYRRDEVSRAERSCRRRRKINLECIFDFLTILWIKLENILFFSII